MKVYKIHLDVDRYKYIMTDDVSFRRRYRFQGESHTADWSPPEFYIYKPKLKTPDFWSLASNGTFAISTALYGQLPVLKSAGEMLPFQCPGVGELLLFNLTNTIDCLDLTKAKYDPLIRDVGRYAFISDRITQSIFKIFQTAVAEMFAAEGVPGADAEFKQIVESKNLKGVNFDKIWGDEDK